MDQLLTFEKKNRPEKELIHVRMRQVFKEIEEELDAIEQMLSILKTKHGVDQTTVQHLKRNLSEFDKRCADKINYLNFTQQYQEPSTSDNNLIGQGTHLSVKDVIRVLEEDCKRWPVVLTNLRGHERLNKESNLFLIMELEVSRDRVMKIQQSTIDVGKIQEPMDVEMGEEAYQTGDGIHSNGIQGASHNSDIKHQAQGGKLQTGTKCQTNMQTELKRLQTTVSTYENENQKIKKEFDELKQQFSRYKENTWSDSNQDRYKAAETERDMVKSKLVEAERQVKALENRTADIETSNHSLIQALDRERSAREKADTQLKKLSISQESLQKQNDSLRTEKEGLLLRLGKVSGEKLTDNNPNVTDLSDKNRPTKLGEMYSELYDNEWTDAFDALRKTGYNEIETIETLKATSMHTLDFCQEKSKLLKKKISDAVNFRFDERKYDGGPGTEQNKSGSGAQRKDAIPTQEDLHIRRRWKPKNVASNDTSGAQRKTGRPEARLIDASVQIRTLEKEVAESMIPILQKEYFETTWDDQCLPAMRPYIEKCLYVCWMMVVQSPPMSFAPEPKSGIKIDTNMYRNYVSTGKRVSYVVWPALLLHQDGALVCKGIVEGNKY